MSSDIDEFFLRLGCSIALPSRRTTSQRANVTPSVRPHTRAQAKADQQNGRPPKQPLETLSPNKKRTRKSDFNIFVDTGFEGTAPAPSAKKSRPNGRVPLAVRTTFASSVPTPTPYRSGQPFPFSPSDPFWEDVENYNNCACYMTPPPTPGHPSSVPEQSPSTPSGVSPGPPPPSLSYSTPRPTTLADQPRRASVAKPLPQPVSTTLYDVLQLDHWKATEEEIKAAYKKIARDNHPDKVALEQREVATHFMQTLNAAKEVLLDKRRRIAYHKSGHLPWTT